ncbi:MAG: glycoside hydrolase family 127 protein [Candidatus Hodarchaeales archaeon]
MKTKEIPFKKVTINDSFWNQRLKTNAEEAIFYQWAQLEKTRCIDNFRILAKEKQGFREGWFFSDSDSYKWLDAANRMQSTYYSEELKHIIDEFIRLILKTQTKEGYLYTYNQILFPEEKWLNLWIEHELYCAGHLIEAAISHYEINHDSLLFKAAIKFADLIVNKFMDANVKAIPGHQEIEIALIKLYRLTKNDSYLQLAGKFIHRRGKTRGKGIELFRQSRSTDKRKEKVKFLKNKYLEENPEEKEFKLPELIYIAFPPRFKRRATYNYFTGKYLQNHTTIEKQITPEGHSVRFSYLMTATAMYCYEKEDLGYLVKSLEAAWNNMVTKRMFVTGGIGSLPGIEGFGRDYELDPKYAYCETCAALGSIYWNFAMLILTSEAKFADLLEWQLYNAASVGIAINGKSYLYRNPLATKGELTRKEWFGIPCCPSNLSRTWASLGQYIYSYSDEEIWVHQYIGNTTDIPLKSLNSSVKIELSSSFPWNGEIQIRIHPELSQSFTINLRIPSWVEDYSIKINNNEQECNSKRDVEKIVTASGFSPFRSKYVSFTREWKPDDLIEISFPMTIKIIQSHPKVTNDFGKHTITRGPLVYCLENIDNPHIHIFDTSIDTTSLKAEYNDEMFDGSWIIRGKTIEGTDLIAIPYIFWANRGKSEMTVMVDI